MGFNELVRSKGYRNFMAKLYGLGAAVVILGALFKINHYPMANEMLILGLTTEALIFAFSAFEPLHEEVDWSLVYPELAGMEHTEDHSRRQQRTSDEERMLSEKLDEMLKAAKIDAELIGNLSSGLNRLSATAESLNASTDIIGVNTHYAEQLVKLTQSLERLDALYTQQLEASSRQMEATQKAHENMTHIAETLAGTLEKSEQYKEEICELSSNTHSLNEIYGGMLSSIKNVAKKG
jgi:gliding motility-associated protein GldL